MGVNKERVELWAQALESEEYVKCEGILRADGDGSSANPYTHCALGVAMEVAQLHGCQFSIDTRDMYGNPIDPWEEDRMPRSVALWYGLPQDPFLELEELGCRTVVYVNDQLKLPFWNMAQMIRATYLKDDDVHGN